MAVKSCPTSNYEITLETEPLAGHKIRLILKFEVYSQENSTMWDWVPVAQLMFWLVRQNI